MITKSLALMNLRYVNLPCFSCEIRLQQLFSAMHTASVPAAFESVMSRVSVRPSVLALLVVCLLCGSSCQRGARFFPVQGKVLVDGKPGEGVLLVFHPEQSSD